MRNCFVASLLLAIGCGGTAVPDDAAPSPHDGGHDAAVVPVDANIPCPETFAGCTEAMFEDHTADTMPIVIDATAHSPFAYTRPCIRVRSGAMVTIVNNTTHPVIAATCSHGGPLPIRPMASTSPSTYTFTTAGAYGYYCNNHGDNGGTGMAGLIVVE